MNPQQPVYTGEGYAPQGSQRKRLLKVGLIAVVVTVASLIAVNILLPKNDPATKASQFMKLFYEGNASETYAMTDAEFKEATPEDEWTATVERISGAYSTSPALGKSEFQENVGITSVKFTAEGSDGYGPYDITVEISGEKGAYFVRYFDSKVRISTEPSV